MSLEVDEHELSLLGDAENPNGEAEKKIEDAAKEEEALENTNVPSSQLKIKFADQVDEEARKTPRFMVENVESPTTSPTKNNSEVPYPDSGETIGFPTHEAVPMTLFYRNQSSVGDSAAQRPTLKSLHKSYDDIDEENMVRFNAYFLLAFNVLCHQC